MKFTKRDFAIDDSISNSAQQLTKSLFSDLIKNLNDEVTLDNVFSADNNFDFTENTVENKIKYIEILLDINSAISVYNTKNICYVKIFTIQGWVPVYGLTALSKVFDYIPAGDLRLLPSSERAGIDALFFSISGKRIIVSPVELKTNTIINNSGDLNISSENNSFSIEYKTSNVDTLHSKVQHTILGIYEEYTNSDSEKTINIKKYYYHKPDTMDIIINSLKEKSKKNVEKSRFSISSSTFLKYNPIVIQSDKTNQIKV